MDRRASRRLLLRDDAYWAPTPDGCHVITHDGTVGIAGAGVSDWLDRLAPALDGTRSLNDLVAGLAPARRQFVTCLVDALTGRDLIRILDDEPDQERFAGTYRAEVALLGALGGDRAFARWRAATIGLRWAGASLVPLADALLRGLLRAGARRIVAAGPIPLQLVETARRDPDQHVLTAPTDPGAHLAGCELLISVTGDTDDALRTDQLSRQSGVPVLQVVPVDGGIWSAGPVVIGTGGPGLGDALLRARGLSAEPATEDGAPRPAVVASMAGRVVTTVLRHVASAATAGDQGRARVVRFGATVGQVAGSSVVRHPLGPTSPSVEPPDPRALVAKLARTEEMEPETFSRRAAACVDPVTGLVAEVGEGDLAQLPLRVARAVVADPVGLLGRSAPRPRAFGWDAHEFAAARQAAALRGLATYASLAVDPRRLLAPSGRPWWPSAGDVTEGLRRLRLAHSGARVVGLGLRDVVVRTVPVEAVHPAVRPNRGDGEYRPPVGTGAGLSWKAALRDALLQHCRVRALSAMRGGACRAARLDLRALPADPDTEYVLAMLQAVGEEVTVHDASGALGVPTAVAAVRGEPVATASATSVTGAVRDALLRGLLARQSWWAGEPAYRPVLPAVPARALSHETLPAPVEPELDVDDLVERLARTGAEPVVVPLDSDPELHRLVPFLVTVVVWRG